MRALRMVGLAVLVFGVSACASSKKEEKPATPEAPATTEGGTPEAGPQARSSRAKPHEGGETAERGAKPPARGQGTAARATGNVAEIDAALVSAAANARALETLAKDPSSYDRQSGRRLLDNARESLNDARSRVVALRSSASKDDRKQLDDLSSRITNAAESLDRVATRIDRPKDVADDAGKAYSELNAAVKPLKNVARAMGSGIEVVGPTG